MEIPRLCSHRTQSHSALCLGKASHYITRQITLQVRRSFALGQRLQSSRCYSWESLGDKEKAVVISSLSKNLQFCRFLFETESEAPGPLVIGVPAPWCTYQGPIVLKRHYTFLLPHLHIRSTMPPSVWTLHTGVTRKYNLKGSV